jgi:hypothetical protein
MGGKKVKTIRCDRCGAVIQNGAYREVRSNIVTPVPIVTTGSDDTGVYISDCLYRPVLVNDLCGACSRAFDSAFDDFVFKFMYEGKKDENNKV